MSDNQNNHPLHSSPQEQHPLNDQPPQKQKVAQGVRQRSSVQIPLATQIPVVTYILIAINAVIFALRYASPELSTDILYAGVTHPELVFGFNQYYRLFTSMFLHFNELHIMFNMMALYYIGGNLERLFGHVRFSIIYVLGGLAGSILPLFFDTGGLGASGAVFAIWGTEAVFIYRNRKLFGAAGQARLRNSLMFMGINFLMGISANVVAEVADSGVRIGNSAHFGGLLAGVILGWLIGARYEVKREETPVEGVFAIQIEQIVSLRNKLPEVLFFTIGLLSILLFARLLYLA